MQIDGYTIVRDGDGNYRISLPNGMRWAERAATLETAKKWVAQHRAERRARADSFETNNGQGWYVMGQSTSVAWYLHRTEAEKDCTQRNYRGGTIYKIEPAS